MRETMASLMLAIERIAVVFERMADVGAMPDMADSLRILAVRQGKELPRSKAIRLLVELGPDNLSAVAKACGVSARTLYRWPEFIEARDRLLMTRTMLARNPRAVRHDEL